MSGKVYLVGAGPGDPELLTFKAWRILNSADVILHDELVSEEILALIPAKAIVHNVGKRARRSSTPQAEINAHLVRYGWMGLRVVRLKGGDPLIFGRAGEEMEALRTAGIDFEVVPGVSAGLAAAASSQIPLTHRQIASSLMVLTGHGSGDRSGSWPARIPATATLLIYMPGYDFAATARQLLAAGLDKATPCAVVANTTTAQEEIHLTSLEELPSIVRREQPTVLLVGEVVRLARIRSRAEVFAHSFLMGDKQRAPEDWPA
jgi:uroporphyrin-III C-methyltransferase